MSFSTTILLNRVLYHPSGCWIWTGARKPAGYGNVWLSGRCDTTHRAAWRVFRGPIPDGLYVCHRCDRPSCINPDHLFLGSPTQNQEDMYLKGRRNLKISDADVAAVRTRRMAGDTLMVIAEAFSITFPYVWQICRGVSRSVARDAAIERVNHGER